jgi:hypothetical protein
MTVILPHERKKDETIAPGLTDLLQAPRIEIVFITI